MNTAPSHVEDGEPDVLAPRGRLVLEARLAHAVSARVRRLATRLAAVFIIIMQCKGRA